MLNCKHLNLNKGPLGYNDIAGKPKKCHRKAIVTLSDDFQYTKVLFSTKKTVTVAGLSL